MKKIKILSIYRGKVFESRGTPIRVRSLLKRLAKHDQVDVTVCSWDQSGEVFGKHFTLTNNHLDDVKCIISYVKKEKIDVVIGHTVATSYYLLPVKFFTKAKVVLEMHGLEEEEAREYGDISWFGYWRAKLWYGLFYYFCDLITTCSDSVTAILLKYNKRVVTMCGGVDTTVFSPQAVSGHYFQKDDRIVIGYAGNSRKWQGVDFLIDAYKQVLATSNKFRLVMLMSETKGLSSTEGLEIFGPIDNADVPKFLVDCDILVIPRPDTPVTRISFPSKLPEYLAMGKALVASNTGDANTVITDGVTGLLYKPGEVSELVNCLRRLEDSGLRSRLGIESAKKAEDLSWDRLSALLVDNISKIV